MVAQNLDKMLVKKRNATLIELARKAVKKYAPGYYREYGDPIIERFVIQNSDDPEFGVRLGRPYYRVTFPYDISKEYFEHGFSSFVDICADKRVLKGIMPGNGAGRRFKVNQTRSTDKEDVEIIPYVERKRPTGYEMFPDMKKPSR